MNRNFLNYAMANSDQYVKRLAPKRMVYQHLYYKLVYPEVWNQIMVECPNYIKALNSNDISSIKLCTESQLDTVYTKKYRGVVMVQVGIKTDNLYWSYKNRIWFPRTGEILGLDKNIVQVKTIFSE